MTNITNVDTKTVLQRSSGTATPTKSGSPAAAVPTENGATQGDQLSLTDRALQINRLLQLVEKQPVIDSQRVEKTSKAVSNGSFFVDPTSIAGKFANFENALRVISR